MACSQNHVVAAQPGDAAPVGLLLTDVQRSDAALVAMAKALLLIA